MAVMIQTQSRETNNGVSATKRYALVGTGSRAAMYLDPLAQEYKEDGQLVALCDTSLTRASYHGGRLVAKYGYPEVPVYAAANFERMLQETTPHVVMVCSMDATHHEYIIKALKWGCDIITEKPMTTDEAKCTAIQEAVQATGRAVRVCFNYRWTPGATKVRQIIANGAIGNVKAVNLEYQLNTSHGADYFRRWHATKANSGGLLVHKSTHHFDLVNWWIDGIPQDVFAYGDLLFYGLDNAMARGDHRYTGYERYADSAQARTDPFALQLEDHESRALYRDAEDESGYIRDRNVFRAGIDIEDTMAVLVRYRSGALLNYSLVAYSPQEGYRVTFTGDKGRLEYTETHEPHIIPKDGDAGTMAADLKPFAEEDIQMHLRVIPHFSPGYDVPIETLAGSHGGGDPLIQEQIFSSNPPQEFWGRNAGHEQGMASVLIGAAANRSLVTGKSVSILDLCSLRPDATVFSELV